MPARRGDQRERSLSRMLSTMSLSVAARRGHRGLSGNGGGRARIRALVVHVDRNGR